MKPSYGLADDDIAKMLEDSFKTAEIDMRARALREAQVEAERMLEATQAALAAELLDADERAQVDTLAAALRAVAQGDDTNAIEAATKALADGTDEFAARRMDKSISARCRAAGSTRSELTNCASAGNGPRHELRRLPHPD